MHIKNEIVKLEQLFKCTIALSSFSLSPTTPLFSYREDEVVRSGSASKLFLISALFEKLSAHPIPLEQSIEIPARLKEGASILADLSCTTMRLDDLVYLLLAHSDTGAQATLETLIKEDEVNEHIRSLGFTKTTYVSTEHTTETHFSTMSTKECSSLFTLLYEKAQKNEPYTLHALSSLSKSRHTYFGLRYLPTSFNTKTPSITKRYSKSGKIEEACNDTCIIETAQGALCFTVAVDHFAKGELYNSVDSPSITLVATISKLLFDSWMSTAQVSTAQEQG